MFHKHYPVDTGMSNRKRSLSASWSRPAIAALRVAPLHSCPSLSSDRLDQPASLCPNDARTALSYVQSRPVLLSLLSNPSSVQQQEDQWPQEKLQKRQIRVTELTEGLINHVFLVEGCCASFLLKYAPPYIKSLGVACQLTQVMEAKGMQWLGMPHSKWASRLSTTCCQRRALL